jgi:hypothetical protein
LRVLLFDHSLVFNLELALLSGHAVLERHMQTLGTSMLELPYAPQVACDQEPPEGPAAA